MEAGDSQLKLLECSVISPLRVLYSSTQSIDVRAGSLKILLHVLEVKRCCWWWNRMCFFGVLWVAYAYIFWLTLSTEAWRKTILQLAKYSWNVKVKNHCFQWVILIGFSIFLDLSFLLLLCFCKICCRCIRERSCNPGLPG
jgi:hypothetical protein